MYASVDENILLTLPEFDHYAQRPNKATYYGSWPMEGGVTINWPQSKGLRVFGYLKLFPAIGSLLSLLRDLDVSALVFAPEVPPAMRQKFQTDYLRFSDEKVNLQGLGGICDLAILNANLASTTTLLLQGVPSFHIPLYIEQAIFARQIVARDLGLAADPDRPERIGARLSTMLRHPVFRDNAVKFAASHNGDGTRKAIDRAMASVSSLI